MSTNRSRRIDRDTAEHLLARAAAGTPDGQASLTGEDGDAGHQALVDLLTAAAAPPAEGELPGEGAALTAFRMAARPAAVPARTPAAPLRRRSMATAALAQAFSAKAAAVALAASALGGVAVAAGGGHLPVVLGGGSGGTDRAAAVSSAAVPVDPSSARPSGTPSATRPGASPGGAPLPSAGSAGTGASAGAPVPGSSGPAVGPGTPSAAEPGTGQVTAQGSQSPGAPTAVPALLTLCEEFAAEEAHGKALRTMAADAHYAPLTRAAGGAEKIKGYCAAVRAGTTGSAREPVTATPSPTADGGSRGGGSDVPAATATAAAPTEDSAGQLPGRSGSASSRR
ncbi:hypothetical protein [Kitasatospora sp. NPDC057015]|uniref:hypothetical protein n=1 Tax=Kitasatospora sp. NPDC057015 TaxID=3346001 RepID=UPI003638976E